MKNMKKVFLALFLALTMIPVAAFADDYGQAAAPSAVTPAQRQMMSTIFRSFGQREQQLQQQFRSQILSAISSEHRTAVANLIGQLAISSNPDPRAAEQQIDSLLSQSEQQAILSAHNSFRQQSKALHDQLRRQLQSETGHGTPSRENAPGMMQQRQAHQPDAGEIVLHTLAHFEPMGMEHHLWGGGPPPAPRR
jgi:hypothetical protein